jgi:hypothetical protein
MQAIRIQTQNTPEGRLQLPPLHLKEGTQVEVIVLVPEGDESFANVMKASETTLDFWDNPTDDQVWNDV